MSKVTDRLIVWDEDPGSFVDFAAQCRWYRDGLRKSKQRLATAHVVRLFAAKGGKTWNLIQRLDNGYLRVWFGLEYLLWRIREEIYRPAITEMTKFLDEYFVRLKKQARVVERLDTSGRESVSTDDKSARTSGANGRFE